MWKNFVERGRPQIEIWRLRIACWIPKATIIHTLRLCNMHCFATATMVARTRLYVTLSVHSLSGVTLIKGGEIAKRTERFTTAVTNYLQHTGTVFSTHMWKRHAKYMPCFTLPSLSDIGVKLCLKKS